MHIQWQWHGPLPLILALTELWYWHIGCCHGVSLPYSGISPDRNMIQLHSRLQWWHHISSMPSHDWLPVMSPMNLHNHQKKHHRTTYMGGACWEATSTDRHVLLHIFKSLSTVRAPHLCLKENWQQATWLEPNSEQPHRWQMWFVYNSAAWLAVQFGQVRL